MWEEIVKRKIYIFLAIACLTVSTLLYGCSQSDLTYTVSFESNYDTENNKITQTVYSGEKII